MSLILILLIMTNKLIKKKNKYLVLFGAKITMLEVLMRNTNKLMEFKNHKYKLIFLVLKTKDQQAFLSIHFI